ncbi:hypothetical protein DYBT9275_02535 [Dyadobacter sp. CECT 9275]|uniref:Alpha/beta fold hydrolase n=1 Tax=Dyadobacter helix TaxID=2822344 RepID=A0A916JBH8_9BACT|nr:alpha/beta fold hydrolase [Dyadobacter sp. CECT 9275]CAG5000802.1 hypothetical protein DYBT9275_02535 [Dyadobacter sp. CECT 9275]
MVKFVNIIFISAFCSMFFSFVRARTYVQSAVPRSVPESDSARRKAVLTRILSQMPADDTLKGHVSYEDKTFGDWLSRTGELPPDFDKMPSTPFLPDPLTMLSEGKDTPITTPEQWQRKRSWLKEQIQYYLSGTYPAQPQNLTAEIKKEERDGTVLLQEVRLRFGPGREAALTIEMMIPPGKGPFPVFITQWNHREWAQLAVRRGYVACVVANADLRDDTESYARIWAGKHDFTRLMRRAFGSFVAVDYLYTLPFIDQKQIGMTGHSRNGKLSMLAGAFDERITAVVSSSGGSGAEIPWRYATPQYVVEDIALLTTAQPAWFHPRLRFFIGNENKLPVDQHSYMALMAPRALLLSTSANESASNPWGAEQAFQSARQVYRLLGAEDQLAIRFRGGFHGTSARDIEDYLDFFDYVFNRNGPKPENKLLYHYTFEKWLTLSGEKTDPLDWPERTAKEMLITPRGKQIGTAKDWEIRKEEILKSIRWTLGEEPAGLHHNGAQHLKNNGAGEDNFGSFLPRPVETSAMGIMKITPYKGFGDYLYGNVYYPKNKVKDGQRTKLPAIIYLHPYDYSKGFSTTDHQYGLQSFFEKLTSQGYAVFAFDMIGFGNRIDEGTRFYERYPHWSKMGKMITDARSAVDALGKLDIIDQSKIYIAGQSLGGTVGLFTAALDQRIAGIVAVAGFAPMHTNVPGQAGIRTLSHLHGLMPRLGFFVQHEERLPFDFQEILAAIAPRPILIIAPEYDTEAVLPAIEEAVREASRVHRFYPKSGDIQVLKPKSENRLSGEIKSVVYKWASEH